MTIKDLEVLCEKIFCFNDLDQNFNCWFSIFTEYVLCTEHMVSLVGGCRGQQGTDPDL